MGLPSDIARVLLVGRKNGVRARVRRWLRGASSDEPAVGATPPADARAAAGAERLDLPDGFRRVLDVADLPPGELAEAIVDGVPIALCNVDGTVYAVSDVCPHAGGPIGDGTLEGATVICPYHGWSFDVRDGSCFVNAEMTLPTYEVVILSGAVCVKVAAAG